MNYSKLHQSKSPNSANLIQSLNIKQISSPKNKKVEGFDKTALSSTFVTKIDRLKNKPKVEVIEDEYINGLQDEIKFLQLELKLLQQKDIQKHNHIDQLEQFFGDGIPINQNILAIKNGFNSYKTTNQKKIKDLQTEKKERLGIIDGLGLKVEKLLTEYKQKEKEKKIGCQNRENQWYGLINKEHSYKKKVQITEEELKTLKLENRKLFQKIETLTRNKLIQNIVVIKYENSKLDRLNKLKQTLKQKQIEHNELIKVYNDLEKQSEEKSYVIKLQQGNLCQRKKTISLERQSDNIRNKIKERQMQLEQRLKQRMNQINSKTDILNKVEAIKQQIKKENSLTIEQVQRMAKDKEVQMLKKIVENNKKLAKYTDHYSNLLSQVETSIEALAERKPEVKSQIQALNLEIIASRKRLQQQKSKSIINYAQMIQLEEKFSSKEVIEPIQDRIKKNNDLTHAYLQERHRYVEEIKIKQKQLELIYILKNLNFEQAEISRTSNKNIQQELLSFLKNWEKIQRPS